MKLFSMLAVLLVLSLTIVPPQVWSSPGVDSRITMGIDWLKGQLVSVGGVTGFARGTDAANSRLVYLEDQALVALALSDYRATHYDTRYDNLLMAAVDVILAAEIGKGDFYEYYDVANGVWQHSGDAYPWDAYAIAALAVTSYRSVSFNEQQLPFWSEVVDSLKQSISSLQPAQRSNGAWAFRESGSVNREALVGANALLLVGLLYVALFEYQWGSKPEATTYGTLAAATAKWLFARQERNMSSPNFGGFPHSDINATQFTDENGVAVFGVNNYYSIIGLILPKAFPSIWDSRNVMADWAGGYVERMRDSFGGPYFERGSGGALQYPKTVTAAAWVLQAMSDVWINLGDAGPGGQDYRRDSELPYEWLTGSNELNVDLQDAPNILGGPGGFLAGINGNVVANYTSTYITASALNGLIRAAYIHVPEFHAEPAVFLAAMLAATILISRIKKKGA